MIKSDIPINSLELIHTINPIKDLVKHGASSKYNKYLTDLWKAAIADIPHGDFPDDSKVDRYFDHLKSSFKDGDFDIAIKLWYCIFLDDDTRVDFNEENKVSDRGKLRAAIHKRRIGRSYSLIAPNNLNCYKDHTLNTLTGAQLNTGNIYSILDVYIRGDPLHI